MLEHPKSLLSVGGLLTFGPTSGLNIFGVAILGIVTCKQGLNIIAGGRVPN